MVMFDSSVTEGGGVSLIASRLQGALRLRLTLGGLNA